MREYVIMTDNTADLPYSYYKEHGVEYTYLTYQMEGETYGKDNELDVKDFTVVCERDLCPQLLR